MQEVFIVDGSRTPFIKATGKVNPLSAMQLAVAAAKPLLIRQPFTAANIEEVITGCVIPAANEANIARIIALQLGCGDTTMGWTVQRNCASGLQALDCAFKDITLGRHNLVLAGGTEAMSRAAWQFGEEIVTWWSELQSIKDIRNKLLQLLKFRPYFLKPVASLLRGLTDPVINMTMGETAEKLAVEFAINRQEMDLFALQSHQKVTSALDKKHYPEIAPLFDWLGNVITADNGVRAETSLDKLANLSPVFDKPFGSVTAGNSSQLSDGAAFLILASRQALVKYNLQPLAKIVDVAWSSLDPSIMGLGPAHAIAKLLQQQNKALEEIDYWEINEAFAVQILANIRALASKKYCQEVLHLPKELGTINTECLNVDGGAIAIGHPLGASGARLVLHLMHVLIRNNAKFGIASLCVGGGQGGAILIENTMGGN